MSDVITNTATTKNVKTDVFFNPFPGLRPFSIDESHLFFGREGQSDEVLRKLSENRFVGVIGASGSGKSSLMYCGLIPVLYGGFIADAGSKWKVVTTRPGRGPVDNLAKALVESDVEENTSKEDINVKSAITSTILRSSSLGLIEAVKQLNKKSDENVLLLVDQFEELFRYKRSKTDSSTVNESVAFVKLLLEAIQQTEVPIYVVLTMRSDFIGDCAQFPSLTKLINDSHYLIPQMTREDMKDAIVGPVAVGGGEISSQLVQQLLNDVGDNQDQLPILQHAMMRTWDFWANNREGAESLDLHHYEAIGRLEKALSLHANECYDELNERQREVCESLFKALTEKGADNRGIRHPTSVDDLAQISRATEPEVIEIVDNFRKAGRSFLAPSYEHDIDKNSVIDISHESLMRIWDRLKAWVEEEANSVQMYLRLSEAAAMYQLGKTGLWRPPDLQLAVNWKEKQKPTLTWAKRYEPAFERAMVFLDTSQKAHETEEQNKIRLQKRALKRSRVFAIILGTLTILSLAAFLYAVVQNQRLDKITQDAVKAKQEALDAKAKSDELRQKAVDAEKAAQEDREKAIAEKEAADKARKEALAALDRAEKAEAQAKKEKEEADIARKIAEQQTALAQEERERAKQQTIKANNAKAEAQTQRMLSVAQSMAVRSTTIRRDTTQKALVAMGAYNFHLEYAGKEGTNTPDVHRALYEATYYLKGDDYNQLKGHKGNLQSLAFNSSSGKLYTSSSDGKVLTWDIRTPGAYPNEFYSVPGYVPREVQVSPDNNKVLVISNNSFGKSAVSIINDKDPSDIQYLEGFDGMVWAGQYVANDKVVTTGTDSSVVIWNLVDGSSTQLVKNGSQIKALIYNQNNGILYAGDDAGNVSAIDISAQKVVSTIFSGTRKITSMALSPNGNRLAVGDASGHIRILNTGTEGLLTTLYVQKARISKLDFSPDGKLLASSTWAGFGKKSGNTMIFKTSDFEKDPIILEHHKTWVRTSSFSPDSRSIVVGCQDSIVRIYPIYASDMAEEICGMIDRNLSKAEWTKYVSDVDDIPYEKVCENYSYGEGIEEKDTKAYIEKIKKEQSDNEATNEDEE